MFTQFRWMDATLLSPVFLVLILCSIVTLGAAIERLYYYSRRRGNPDETLRRATGKVRLGQLNAAASICEHTAHPVGPVAFDVLAGADKPAESFEERLHIALSNQKLLLERNLNVLGTMAGVAPLIGLLGTVWGILRAFSNMAKTGSAAPAVVASGVAEALTTTVAGLVIAIPALMLYNHFSRRMNVMLTVAENHSRTLRSVIVEEAASRRAPEEPMRSRRIDRVPREEESYAVDSGTPLAR
jgi:biopolymer transport protein ExbB